MSQNRGGRTITRILAFEFAWTELSMKALLIAGLALAGISTAAQAAVPFADNTWSGGRATAAAGTTPIHRVTPATAGGPVAPGNCAIEASPPSLPAGGGAVQLALVCQAGDPPTGYMWSGPGVNGQMTASVTTTLSSTATFTAYATNAGGTSNTAQRTVQVASSSSPPTDCVATINGSTTVTLTSAGGNVTLSVAGCRPVGGLTYAWSRNGVAGVSTAPSYVDTPGANPLLGPNNTTSARTSSYQVQVCNGTACVTVPAVPLTAVVPAPTATAPTGCNATINGAATASFPSSGATAVNLTVLGCTPAIGLTFAWTRNGQPASTQQNWTDIPSSNPLLGPNTTSSPRVSSYLVQVCNGSACATFPASPLTATVAAASGGGGCTYSATVNGAASVALGATGGSVQLAAVATCATPQTLTYNWSRNGVANVAGTATWTDTATANPLLAANAGNTYRVSTYTVDICAGASCVTVPAAPPKGTTVPLTVLVAPGTSDTSAPVSVLEFYHESLDHYFISWVPEEIGKLVAGTVIKGWRATGQSFLAYVTARAGTSPVCRYYIPPGLGDTHFFGRGTAECTETGQKFPAFILEDPAFMHVFLPNAGVCPASTTPVYRVFSNRADANHRYMTSLALRGLMVGYGWLIEGDGPDAVVMCSPT